MKLSEPLLDAYMAVRRKIARVVGNIAPPNEVEDIVQETFVRLCQVNNKKIIRNPQAYIFRTARNLALDHVKRAESRLTAPMDMDELDFQPVPEMDIPYALAASAEEFELLCKAVRSLPKQCRRAFVLKKVYGYTQKEIMVEMGVGQATVETHIVNGTKRCVQFMRAHQKDQSRLESGLSSSQKRPK